jgi:peptidylprolyl isomerase
MKRIAILFLFITLTFSGCDSPEKKTVNTNNNPAASVKKSTVEKKKNTKKPESINDRNVVPFLSEYGKNNPETLVLLKTRLGNIKIQLYKDTPLHRANFIFLAKEGYFDTTCFYRVVPGFIIQGGNSENISTMRYRNKYHNYFVPAEFVKQHKHKYGAVAMARDWENNPTKKSTAFEFYIVQDRKGAHHLNGEHTVFGEVVSGFSTIDKIANLKAGGDEWPLDDVFMTLKVLK